MDYFFTKNKFLKVIWKNIYNKRTIILLPEVWGDENGRK